MKSILLVSGFTVLIVVSSCANGGKSKAIDASIQVAGTAAIANVDPDHDHIIYWGRVDHSNPKAPAFEYSGVTIRAQFTGSSIQAILHDYAAHGATSTNYFYKIVDGGTPEKFEALAGRNTYDLASGLGSGSHTIELVKLTEAAVGKTAFEGFVLAEGGSLEKHEKEPVCDIEFIGNSITCGYGNEVSLTQAQNPTTGFNSINENNYKAWGYVAARKLGMAYRAVSYSGRGMYRNNSGSTIGVMPAIYDRIYPDVSGSVSWDHTAHHPEIIVINLGTNDFAPEANGNMVDEVAYKTTYVDFVTELIGYHPDVTVICAVGTMMSDYWPQGTNSWTRLQTYVQDVVSTLKDQGHDDVHFLTMTPQTEPYGEDWHPTIGTHAVMADALVDKLGEIGHVCDVSTGVITSDQQDSQLAGLMLYPNPSTGMVSFGSKLAWTLYDLQGQMVESGIGDSADFSRLDNGTYIVQAGTLQSRLVKLKF